ncbi:MAG: extracellular solute-binding protein [Oscillospiraceae bacterium]
MTKKYRPIAMFLLAAIILCFSACAKPENSPFSNSGQPISDCEDILTQTVISPDKIPVTILVKYAFSINTFEAEAEKRFPQLDIIQVGNYTAERGLAEYEARLKHDDLTDIVMTWPLETGEQYWENQLLDLSSYAFTSRYNTSMLEYIERDGRLYYLPGPAQIRAIVYNKTLFEENGWDVPSDYSGFVKLCHKIDESGIRALQLGVGNPEVLDTAFVGFGYCESFSKPEAIQGLADYDRGIGRFENRFGPALDIFQSLIDNGILRSEDLQVRYQDRERMLFSRECAMVEDSVLIARMGYDFNGCTDEFALMPFFSPCEKCDWARLYPVCYVGLSKHLVEPQNSEKYKLILQLLDYISTPDGQLALAADTGAMFSSLNNMPPPDIPEIQDIVLTLEHGRYAVFPTLKNAQSALRKGLAGMVAGTLTKSDVCAMVDRQNLSPPVAMSSLILGTATEDFSVLETGNFLTDAMRKESGCEIALFLDNGKDGRYNGKGVSGRIYKGDLTNADIMRVLPDLKHGEDGVLWKISMSGENLLNTLEYSISVDNNKTGWFYYFSGLKVSYAPSGKPGERIIKITDADGNSIDLKRLYSIAVMDYTVQSDYTVSCEKTDIKISTILEGAFAGGSPIAPSRDGRFTICPPQ